MQTSSFLKPRFWTQTAAVFAAVVGLTLSANAQVLINDNFLDGNPDVTGDGSPAEAAFFTTSSTGALESVNGPVGLDFASGSSGRSIHTGFAAQSLLNAGDSLRASITFDVPATVGLNENIRFGFFDSTTSPGFSTLDAMGALVNPNGFAGDISASSGAPEPGLNVAGFSGGADINALNGMGDLEFRIHDLSQATGRLLTTNTGFVDPIPDPDNLTSGSAQGTDSGVDFPGGFPGVTPTPSTTHVLELGIELLANGNFELTESLFGETFTVEDLSGLTGNTFDLLVFQASSDAFGSSNVNGEDDNGLTFTNLTVEFTPGVTANIPEPSSLALLGLIGCAGFIRRRR